jgi:hypothetical protein
LPLLSSLFRNPSSRNHPGARHDLPQIPEKSRIRYLIFVALLTLFTGFAFNTPSEILNGLGRILTSSSILLTDYMVVGNIGSAFLNSGLLMLIAIFIAVRSHTSASGPLVAAVFTIGGFAFFGKNLYNIWPIMGGVMLYAKYQKEPFGKFILPAFFGTALGPLVSQISFGFNLPPVLGIFLGILAGISAGFILPPLANHFIRFHQGYNLYNIGFTSGIVGLLYMSLLRGFSLDNPPTLILLEGHMQGLSVYLAVLFLSMFIYGFETCSDVAKGLSHLFSHPGRLVSDFVASDGFPVTLINMGLLGFVSTTYVILMGGTLNGPILGGIFTVVGFGAFGKHVKNVVPVMAGIYLANLVFHWEVSSIGSLLAALFATTLAPIAGAYGIIPGILAGFLHMAVVMNVGYLHGGMNLYNNGFSGGFVAAILVPIFDSLKISSKNWEEER